jgi:hypothetical protein
MPPKEPPPAVVRSDSILYVKTSNNKTVPAPMVSFYTNIPENARCIFSINQRNPGRRRMNHVLPPRSITQWSAEQIEEKVDNIRTNYPADVKHVRPPHSWDDLYQYFDAYDLWFMGAWNLWSVIHRLAQKTDDERKIACDWAQSWLTWDANREKLSTWTPHSDILTQMSASDWVEGGLAQCTNAVLDMVREELARWHHSTYYNIESPVPPAAVPQQSGSAIQAQGMYILWSRYSEPLLMFLQVLPQLRTQLTLPMVVGFSHQ